MVLGAVGAGAVLALEPSGPDAPTPASIAHAVTTVGSEGVLTRLASIRPPKLAQQSPLHHLDVVAALATLTALAAMLLGWFVADRRALVWLRRLAFHDGARAPPLAFLR